jgi:hypothetical protein
MNGLDWLRTQFVRLAGWVRHHRQEVASQKRLPDNLGVQLQKLKAVREESKVLSQQAQEAASTRMTATDELRVTIQRTLDRVSHRSPGYARR